MRFNKPFDIEKFIDQKIAKQEKQAKRKEIVHNLGAKMGRFWTIWNRSKKD